MLSPSYIEFWSSGANSDDKIFSGALNATPRHPSASA
jgi:hypothetical protein